MPSRSCVLRCFFFSCRRRHTISLCDWSSDVCSSDLDHEARAEHDGGVGEPADEGHPGQHDEAADARPGASEQLRVVLDGRVGDVERAAEDILLRSEERRVGKESVCECLTCHTIMESE